MKNQQSIPGGKAHEHDPSFSNPDQEHDNLGLDADHSSEVSRYKVNLNNDNDLISHNPDGEDDDQDLWEGSGSAPLEDK